MKIIAHRGYGSPENSIVSFENAINHGFSYIELDVHRTKDGKWVIFHDFELPNGLTLEETLFSSIQQSFEPNNIPPLLDDVLKKFPEAKFNIELKVPSHPEDPHFFGEELANYLKTLGVTNILYVSSFNLKALIGFQRISTGIPLSFLCLVPRTKTFDKAFRKVKNLYSINPLYILLRKKHVEWAHKRGLEVHPWTVNCSKWIKRMIGLGVDGIITDDPPKVRTLLDQISN